MTSYCSLSNPIMFFWRSLKRLQLHLSAEPCSAPPVLPRGLGTAVNNPAAVNPYLMTPLRLITPMRLITPLRLINPLRLITPITYGWLSFWGLFTDRCLQPYSWVNSSIQWPTPLRSTRPRCRRRGRTPSEKPHRLAPLNMFHWDCAK